MALAQGAGGQFPFLPLGEGKDPQLSIAAPQPSSQRLINALETLEARIKQLEHTAQPTLPAHPSDKNTPMNHLDNGSVFPNGANGGPHGGLPIAPVTALLAKGQALLNSDNAERALECFDEVLRLDPDNTEGLIKKGTALERLRRLPEAIDCYDLAIAANPGLTIAYLYKGGLFNRMERFTEALECYEKALQAQEKRGA
jgi:tetratricopeptide (TPR) repeat protein